MATTGVTALHVAVAVGHRSRHPASTILADRLSVSLNTDDNDDVTWYSSRPGSMAEMRIWRLDSTRGCMALT